MSIIGKALKFAARQQVRPVTEIWKQGRSLAGTTAGAYRDVRAVIKEARELPPPPDSISQAAAQITNPRERFKYVASQRGWTADTLQQRAAHLRRMQIQYALLCVLGVAFAITVGMAGGLLMGLIITFGLTAIGVQYAVATHYRAQMELGALITPGELFSRQDFYRRLLTPWSPARAWRGPLNDEA